MKQHAVIALVVGLAIPVLAWTQDSFGQRPGAGGYVPQAAQGGYPAPPSGMQPGGGQMGQQMPAPQGTYPNMNQGGYPPQAAGMPQGPRGSMPGQPAPGFGGSPMPGMNQPGGMNPLQMVLQKEQQDFGVPPQKQLHAEFHAPTPTSIPGGQVITTDRLLALYQQGGGLLVFDVLGSGQMLPMAQNAVGAAQPGSFNDATQQQFGQYLQQVTQGNRNRPMVFYCQGTSCWMSYNAALRAIHLGYKQVYWYRGGVEAWFQVQQMSMNAPPQMQRMPAAGGNMGR